MRSQQKDQIFLTIGTCIRNFRPDQFKFINEQVQTN